MYLFLQEKVSFSEGPFFNVQAQKTKLRKKGSNEKKNVLLSKTA
jgi:hypothetical protein